LGDFFTGGAAGCLDGALLAIDGAGEALDALEGGEAATIGTDGAEDVSTLGDDMSGNGSGEDGSGEDSCTTTPNSFPGHTKVKAVMPFRLICNFTEHLMSEPCKMPSEHWDQGS
jgi:hypothetical protein